MESSAVFKTMPGLVAGAALGAGFGTAAFTAGIEALGDVLV